MKKIIFIISILIATISNSQIAKIGKFKLNSDLTEFKELLKCPKKLISQNFDTVCEIISDTTSSINLKNSAYISQSGTLIGSINKKYRTFYIKKYRVNDKITLENIYLNFFNDKLVKVIIYNDNDYNLYNGLTAKYLNPDCFSNLNIKENGVWKINYNMCKWRTENDTLAYIKYYVGDFETKHYALYNENFIELKSNFLSDYDILYQKLIKREEDNRKAALLKDL